MDLISICVCDCVWVWVYVCVYVCVCVCVCVCGLRANSEGKRLKEERMFEGVGGDR